MMKATCKQCGAMIESADPEVAKKQMEKHVAAQHGNLAELYNSLLKTLQQDFFAAPSRTRTRWDRACLRAAVRSVRVTVLFFVPAVPGALTEAGHRWL